MRFVTFELGGRARIGVIDGDDIVDLQAIDRAAPDTLKELIARGVEEGLAESVAGAPASARHSLAKARLLSPIPDPGKIVCVGLNYHDHAQELGQAVPDYPSFFMRTPSSLVGAGQPMLVPRVSSQLDYEAELVIVIGSRCRHVPEAEALGHVFGYTCLNEATVRDYQHKSSQWTIAKNFDASGAIGPWITTADAVPAGADGLQVRTILNGKTMQDASTSLMIFSVARIVSLLSAAMTLEPGDLISSGTPAGVGVGLKPPVWLKPGDTVTIDIEHVGALTNPIAAESA
jgi:2-keto-4-pentenoate hydratase/2-oxohepta-3-ene-1,7-dioic acid hydratase in catechol pathway